MTDNELLLAISNMLNPIKKELQDVKSDIGALRAEFKDDIGALRMELQELKDRVKKIELTQETLIIPRLDTIESCYTSTYYRYKEQVETYESMKQDISILKSIAAEHSDRLHKIS